MAGKKKKISLKDREKIRKLKKRDLVAQKAIKIRDTPKENIVLKKEAQKDARKFRFSSLYQSRTSKIRIVLLILVAMLLGWIFWDLPLPNQLDSAQVPVSTKLYDRNGNLLYEIYADKKSTPLSINDIPQQVKNATIAIEDKDFYSHYGISISGMTRAAYKILFRQQLEGGSTLTQQLVKTALLTPDRTIRRKIRELALTLIVETLYSKDHILEMYLNQIPYGSTAYGIGSASELYFGKEVKDLTLSETALLAGLTAAPSRYSPFGANPELAKQRQEIVLRRMVEDGYISQEESDRAKEEPLVYTKQERLKAPHFSLWVKQELANRYGEATVEKGGLRVTTTLDLELQELAEKAVLDEVTKLTKQNVGNGAALVTRPATGEVLAMVGSKDYFAEDEDGKVNLIFRQRQPGSSIKPLTYALGIRDGLITASTPFADVPTCFTITGQAPYCPKNYDGNFHGAVHTRFALGNSYNIPAVRALALTGLENFITFANDMGIESFQDPSRYGLSLTLGGGEVYPSEMAIAYGVFANQGIKQPLISILKVEDWKGKVLEENDTEEIELSGNRVLDAETSFIISHILSDNNARIGAFGPSSFLNVRGHPEVSVKTGTTNDRRDNWTIGYNTHAVVLTWVGNNDNSPMSGAVSGVSGASPIWNSIMKAVLDKAEKGVYSENDEGHGWPKQPSTVIGAQVCATTGIVPTDPANPGCQTRFEYFKPNSVGAKIQSGVTDVRIDRSTGSLTDREDLPPEMIEVTQKPYLLDPLGTLICLDCTIASQSATIRYPLQTSRKPTL